MHLSHHRLLRMLPLCSQSNAFDVVLCMRPNLATLVVHEDAADLLRCMLQIVMQVAVMAERPAMDASAPEPLRRLIQKCWAQVNPCRKNPALAQSWASAHQHIALHGMSH